ncbi:uncharacterized protein DS421_3g97730 [Arachis hypogaea]|nr:uncharacterized protein DS421_3g97730 [Arachis hypogaea]
MVRPRFLLPRRVSHTLPPLNAIVPYLAEARFGDTVPLRDFTFDNFLILALVERWRLETHMFHLPWGEVTITLQDVAYHLGLRAHGNPVGGCLRDIGQWYNTETWAMVEQLLGARPPLVAQQAAQRKESFTLKLVWLHKSNNLVHVRWLPLLRDFAECRSLCLVAQRGVMDITGCTPLLMNKGVYQYPLAANRDQHQSRVLHYRVSIDQLRLHRGCTTTHPALQALCPHWFREEDEWGTWLSAVPIVCFNIIQFYYVDRVKRQFNGEQPVLGIPVNLDRYLITTGRGEYVWWPERLQQWYDGRRQRFESGHKITVHYTVDARSTVEYYDWWRGACRVRHLSGQEVLEDPRLVELPHDVQPTVSQPRDDLTLPRGMPDRRRCAREVKEDTRRPARRERGQRERRPNEPIRRERVRPRRAWGDTDSEEEAEFDHHEDEGQVPVHGVVPQKAPTPPRPPPPLWHGAWHSSGSGWHEGTPSMTQHEEDEGWHRGRPSPISSGPDLLLDASYITCIWWVTRDAPSARKPVRDTPFAQLWHVPNPVSASGYPIDSSTPADSALITPVCHRFIIRRVAAVSSSDAAGSDSHGPRFSTGPTLATGSASPMWHWAHASLLGSTPEIVIVVLSVL